MNRPYYDSLPAKLMFILLGSFYLGCNSNSNTFVVKPSPADEPVGMIESVTVTGSEGVYTFSVKISSPDTGCDQYADWWEVVSDSGALLYRRILTHSHVDEQPFTRSGSPVPISADQEVWVRMHMNNSGYSQAGAKGSVESGFSPATLDAGFALDLEKSAPLPDACAF